MKKKLQHLAIIMDGNGRWATKRGFKRSMGHKAGSDALKKIVPYVFRQGISVLSVYAFSTENFQRDPEEVNYLMDLFISEFKNNQKQYEKENIKVIFSGEREPLRPEVLEAMDSISEKTRNNTGGIFNVCINYGGRREIVSATKKIIQKVLENKINVEEMDETLFEKYLYQDLPPIDFLIRTSGETRISNFMLWQLSYAELYFTNTLFPDFNCDELQNAIEQYQLRDRRFGGAK